MRDLDAARSVTSGDANIVDEFGEVYHSAQQVSCMDLLLRAGDMDSAQPAARPPVVSRYVGKESNLYMSPAEELPATSSRVDELLPLKPHYSAAPDLYRDAPGGVWCAYSSRSEPEGGGPGGHNLLCKYCNCGQASLGSCHCAWYCKGEQGGKGGMRAAMAQGYGQVESYQSAMAQGQSALSAIKSEPSVWVDCTDRSFR